MIDIILPVTSMTALCAAVLILALTVRVVQFRRRDGVVIGDADNRVLAKAVRGHGNAVEQLPIALILMALSELQGASATLLAAISGLLITGRVMHAVYFAFDGTHWRLRFLGMVMTFAAQAALILVLAAVLVS